MNDAGFVFDWLLDAGCWMLVAGCWVLGAGLVVAGSGQLLGPWVEGRLEGFLDYKVAINRVSTATNMCLYG